MLLMRRWGKIKVCDPCLCGVLAHVKTEESAASVSTSVESKSKHGPVSDMQRNESEIVSSSSSLGQITISQDTGTAIDARSLTLPHNNDIDRKYSSKGRYGFEASKEPSTLRLTTGASDGLREIPELGLLEGSASDTEETSELGKLVLVVNVVRSILMRL